MNSPAVVNFENKPNAVELREVPSPTIGDEDVLLEVHAVGVCGSDLHQWAAQHSWAVNYPVILGHDVIDRLAGLHRQVHEDLPAQDVIA